MGCVVNGPGESKAANIGISLPGTGEAPNCPVYIDGEHFTTLRGTYDELAEGFRALVDNYVATRLREAHVRCLTRLATPPSVSRRTRSAAASPGPPLRRPTAPPAAASAGPRRATAH